MRDAVRLAQILDVAGDERLALERLGDRLPVGAAQLNAHGAESVEHGVYALAYALASPGGTC